jgi:hypothetical protein
MISLFPLVASYQTLLVEGCEKYDFSLVTVIDKDSGDIPFINVCSDDHVICVWEGYELNISFGEG